jgi:hypothetical protein
MVSEVGGTPTGATEGTVSLQYLRAMGDKKIPAVEHLETWRYATDQTAAIRLGWGCQGYRIWPMMALARLQLAVGQRVRLSAPGLRAFPYVAE